MPNFQFFRFQELLLPNYSFFKGNLKEVQQNKSAKAVGHGNWRNLAVTEELSEQQGSKTVSLRTVKGPFQFCEVK